MTVTLNRDEGSEEPAGAGGGVCAAKRASATKSKRKPRSNADCLGSSSSSSSSSARGGRARGDVGVGAGKRSRTIAGDDSPGNIVGGAAMLTASGASARQHFLRRYYHHVAFRRLSPPVTNTETVEMPVPLHPTCLDVRGCMVALGTREGPVLLFDVGPRPSGAAPPSSKEGLRLPDVAGAGTTAAAAASASATSSEFGGSTSRDHSRRDIRRGGGSTHAASAAGAAANSVGTSTTGRGGKGEDRGSAGSSASVTRVYGSLADGTGPVSSVILDRAKVIAAGRGSRISGGGYVIRIYTVDSTRLLRTLRCVSEVSRMCLFDPLLAVLSAGSGRLSFRDLYADGGSGLGQRTASDVSAVAFAAVERGSTGGGSNGNPNAPSRNDDQDNDNHVVLHCVDRRGTVFEASTFGAVWNVERGSSQQAGVPAEAAAAERGWHVCADLEASLLIRATPWGDISGWRLHPSGRRARGPIFSFLVGSSSVSSSRSPAARRLTSVALAAGGLILATAAEGAAPKLWDLRLARRSQGWILASEAASAVGVGGAGERGRESSGGAAGNQAEAPDGPRPGNAHVGGGARGGTRGRGREVRPWPAGAWAVGVAVDARSGRLVSACSDGRMRITMLRSNNEEARLRAAVLVSRRAKHTVGRRKETP
eukprot:g6366.t1